VVVSLPSHPSSKDRMNSPDAATRGIQDQERDDHSRHHMKTEAGGTRRTPRHRPVQPSPLHSLPIQRGGSTAGTTVRAGPRLQDHPGRRSMDRGQQPEPRGPVEEGSLQEDLFHRLAVFRWSPWSGNVRQADTGRRPPRPWDSENGLSTTNSSSTGSGNTPVLRPGLRVPGCIPPPGPWLHGPAADPDNL
jgi:hypothetical protein